MFELKIFQLNSVNESEYAFIVASTEAAFNKNYDCRACLKLYKDPEMVKKAQDLKSCRDPGEFRFQISNVQFRKCPGNYNLPQITNLLSLFFNYEKFGLLPDPGSIWDQNFKSMQILAIMEEIIGDNRKKLMDKEKRAAKAKSQRR